METNPPPTFSTCHVGNIVDYPTNGVMMGALSDQMQRASQGVAPEELRVTPWRLPASWQRSVPAALDAHAPLLGAAGPALSHALTDPSRTDQRT